MLAGNLATTQQGAWRVCHSEVKEEPAERAGDMSGGRHALPLAGTENMHQHPLKKQHNHPKVYKRSPAHAMPQMP
jgi:hypothetical protein